MGTVLSKLLLTGSTSGAGILVAATTLGTANTIHTAVSGAVNFHEIWLWATNNHTSSIDLTILWGGVADPKDKIVVPIPNGDGLFAVIPGMTLNGGLIVKAFASVASKVSIQGHASLLTVT